MQSFVHCDTVYGEHSHLDVRIQFVVERSSIDLLGLRYFVGQDLFNYVPLYPNLGQPSGHTPDLRGPRGYLAYRHDLRRAPYQASGASAISSRSGRE